MNRLWLTVVETFDFSPTLALFQIVVADTCRRGDFHPVLDYLNGLAWDGAARIDRWLIDYCMAADMPFNRAVSRLVLIAAVRRVRKPGVKFDVLTVLESPEGFSKSMMLSVLAVNESAREAVGKIASAEAGGGRGKHRRTRQNHRKRPHRQSDHKRSKSR